MIGYVKPDVDELKVKDLKLYRAYYCSVCTELAKKYGPLSRLWLSYDATFFSLFLDAFRKEEQRFSKARCPLPPFRKKRIVENSFGVKKGAQLSRTAFRMKLEDTVYDEKGPKKMWAEILLTFFVKKNELLKKIREKLNKMRFLELSECEEPNEPADVFGEIVSFMAHEEKSSEGKQLLFLIGKWVYLVDALDDIDKDLKSGSYNPYVLKYKKEAWRNFESLTEFIKNSEKMSMKFLLLRMREELSKTENKMNKNLSVIRNIVTLGIPKVTEKVLGRERDCERSVRSARS